MKPRRSNSKNSVTLFLILLSTLVPASAQTQDHAGATPENPLKNFLRHYLGEPYAQSEQEGATQYSAAFVDLNDNGEKEVIVYVTGRDWCGSGGCVMLILAPEGPSYGIVTKTTVTRLPIRVLNTKSNGWHDISAIARTNGVEPLYEAILSFDGKTYPSNPSVPPAHRLTQKTKGKIAIDENSKKDFLYR
jgi:hypothetical protein